MTLSMHVSAPAPADRVHTDFDRGTRLPGVSEGRRAANPLDVPQSLPAQRVVRLPAWTNGAEMAPSTRASGDSQWIAP